MSDFQAYSKIDSLLSSFKQSKVDSVKIDLLYSIMEYYNDHKPEETKKYLEKLREIAEIKSDDLLFTRAKQFEAIMHVRLGDVKKSNELLFETLDELKNLDKKKYLARSYNYLGLNYTRLAIYDTAANYFQKAIDISKKHNFVSDLATNYVSMGILNKDVGNDDQALMYYYKALEIFQKINDKEMMSLIYSNISSSYDNKKEYDKALEYIDRSIEYYLLTKDSSSLGISYHNKGAILFHLKRYEESILFLKKSRDIKKNIGRKISIAFSDFALGEVFAFFRKKDSSLYYLKNAAKTFDEVGADRILLKVYLMIDSVYRIYGNYPQAYEYYRKYSEIKDSIYKADKEKVVSEFNAKFDLENKKQENEILKMKSDRQFFIIVVGIVVLAFIAVFSFLLYSKNRRMRKINSELEKNRRKIEDQNTELDTINTELEAINQELTTANNEMRELIATKDKFFSIISHDLKGPATAQEQIARMLNEQYDSMEESNKREFIELLSESTYITVNLLENLLTWGRSQMNKIKMNPEYFNLHENINNTVYLLKTNAELKNISIINKCPNEVVVFGDPNLISTVVRNITNNGIKFTPNDGSITIDYLRTNNEDHQISISDTGIGMDETTVNSLFKIDKATSRPGTNDEAGTGLGLIISKEFIDMHNGDIWVESKPGKGTTFYFTIPAKKSVQH